MCSFGGGQGQIIGAPLRTLKQLPQTSIILRMSRVAAAINMPVSMATGSGELWGQKDQQESRENTREGAHGRRIQN